MEAATQRIYLNRCSWKVKKNRKRNTWEKVHVHIYLSKILQKLKVISSYVYGKKYFQGTKMNKNSKVFETENWKFCAKQNHALFLIEGKF